MPAAISTPAPNSEPIASHSPLLDERAVGAYPAEAATVATGCAGGATGTIGTPEGEWAGAGTLTAACVVAGGLAIRPAAPAPGASVPIRVSSGDIGAAPGRGVDANVVPWLGSADTGTLFNAFINASAVWKRSAGSLAMAIRMIWFNAGGRSAR